MDLPASLNHLMWTVLPFPQNCEDYSGMLLKICSLTLLFRHEVGSPKTTYLSMLLLLLVSPSCSCKEDPSRTSSGSLSTRTSAFQGRPPRPWGFGRWSRSGTPTRREWNRSSAWRGWLPPPRGPPCGRSPRPRTSREPCSRASQSESTSPASCPSPRPFYWFRSQ